MKTEKTWKPLTELERIEIIKLAEAAGHQWKFIGAMVNRNSETCKKFYYSFVKYKTLFPKQGRPIKNDQIIQEKVVNSIESNPKQSLKNLSGLTGVPKTTAKMILNDHGVKYFKLTSVPPLDEVHKQKRLFLCDMILTYNYLQLPPIIFTDESTICENLNEGGIWRKWGHHPPESFFEKQQHTISIMVWGGELAPEGLELLCFIFSTT